MYLFKPGRILLNKKLRELDDYVTGDVLDVGSGDKFYGSYFKNYKNYTRLEISEKFKPDIIASAYEIPVKDNTFDTIFCTQVFEHLNDPEKALKEFQRVLKAGGICIITTPMFNELHEEPIDYFRYTRFIFDFWAKKYNFEVIKIDSTSGFFALIAQMNIRYWYERSKNNFLFYKVVIFLAYFYGKIMLWLDSKDHSMASKKFTVDWCVIYKKI